ncbi:hypothetical protein [Cupriavidus sp. UYPR2.512]|uniref:hypothetical protein n=1 Tax=Cupriavidus sp. UYPR2.512 TaxID=1080187 RepID=UPI0003659D9B|nr:hypothetical protein [Cupriavidus sp. UYPR2.512]UIF90868.1 hypothetical protein KAF44_32285 [Cupriavidus necator]
MAAGFDHIRNVLLSRGEKSLVATIQMRIFADGGCAFVDEGIPEFSVAEREFPLPRGRADLALFHDDGTATVVEAKDGGCGVRDVVAGIGQVVCYATQMGMSTGAPKKVRKVLMFSSTGNEQDDQLIEMSCRAADVLPVYFPHIKQTKTLFKLLLVTQLIAEREKADRG